ncbi:uncharacterized protein HKW66_Vig0075270 [Vigna angularis]|uniref:NAC domain-containing protein n=1 Tax=Phaseolus angularis TaxID=3914 RepID=A0A8T0K5V4_PHAAN|nr:uncharacterized protein HKW66_Vig0075270 [Vigna angularis]
MQSMHILGDAYALCRVFKKTTVIPPKVGDQHYVNVTTSHANQIIASDQSSSINELYSEEDLLNLPTTSTSSFPNYGSMSYPPSKVDVALECARMQHRFSMPPLQMQDLEFPQVGISKLKMAQGSSSMSGTRNETDILQEILSVAHASQELINQSNYSSQPFMNANENYAPHESDFTFMVGTNYNHVNDMNTMGFVDKAWEDQNTRSIEIGDLDDGFKTDNLRWVGMSSKNVGKSFMEEQQNIVPIDDISNFQTNTEENEMKVGFEKHSCNKEITDTEIDEFSMGFMNDEDPNENFLNEENIDYSNSTNFDVVEETKTNHGMFVSTHQVADTFFHQVAPSQTLKVQLNPVMAGNECIENARVSEGLSFFRKFKAYVTGKLRNPSKTIGSALEFIFALLLMHCVFLKEFVEDWKSELKNGGSVYTMKRMREAEERVRRNEEEKVWLVGMKYGKGFSMVLKKISIFLTISLALFTMWANHIIVHS